MDLLKKIVDELEPVGGELFTDRFIEARRASQIADVPAPRAGHAGQAAAGRPKAAPLRAETVRVSSLKPKVSLEPEPVEADDTGQLRAEVNAFLNRDEAEGTDDTEVQEFLKERKGFDPTEFE